MNGTGTGGAGIPPSEEMTPEVFDVVPAGNMFPLASYTPAMAIERAEKLAEVMPKLQAIALRQTRSSDWTDYGGKPRPNDSAVNAIATTFGLQMSNPGAPDYEEFRDDTGKYYIYTFRCAVLVTMTGAIHQVQGSCSSRDPFFGTVKGKPKAVEDVDKRNVKAKAFTNLRVNAAIAGAGLKGLGWPDLEKFGIRPGDAGKANFSKGRKGGDRGVRDTKPAASANQTLDEFEFYREALDREGVDACSFVKNKDGVALSVNEIRRFSSERQIVWLTKINGWIRERYPSVGRDYDDELAGAAPGPDPEGGAE